MDRSPLEIIDIIVIELEKLLTFDGGFDELLTYPDLDSAKLFHYSTITRHFQNAIERRNFKCMDIEFNEFAQLQSMVDRNQHRSSYIKTLKIVVELPTAKRQQPLETVNQWNSNNHAFTEAIKSIFTRVSSWNSTNLELELSVKSPLLEFPLLAFSWMRNHLTLLNPDAIPECRVISSIHIAGVRAIHPRSVTLLGSKCPKLKAFTSRFYDREGRFPHLRQAHHYQLAQSLCSLPVQYLERVDLSWKNFGSTNMSVLCADNIDHLSKKLHWLSLSPNLRELSINGCAISPCLFWPDDETGSYWPKLEIYSVHTTLTTPAGDFFIKNIDGTDPYLDYHNDLTNVPGFGSIHKLTMDIDWKTILTKWTEDSTLLSEGIMFLRSYIGKIMVAGQGTVLDGKLFESYMLSMIKAKSSMPKIKNFCFEIDHGGPPFNFAYDESGYNVNNTTADPWRPSSELMHAMKASLQEHQSVRIHIADSI
jgi:hypothetical protein